MVVVVVVVMFVLDALLRRNEAALAELALLGAVLACWPLSLVCTLDTT